jgi:hypothetical protein
VTPDDRKLLEDWAGSLAPVGCLQAKLVLGLMAENGRLVAALADAVAGMGPSGADAATEWGHTAIDPSPCVCAVCRRVRDLRGAKERAERVLQELGGTP